MTKETYNVDIRHILIEPEGGTLSEDGQTTVYSDEEWEACRQKAQEVLDTWKAGEATEDSFAALAKEHSADGNASEGGIYTGMTVNDNLVEPFKEWIFDESREFGNTDLVKTEFGYHVMFFVGKTYTWSGYCSTKMLQAAMQYEVDTAKEQYPIEVDRTLIVLS
ncbi:MAG: peptidylprolyl isomerase [Phascolarctobacterium sp.]|nr:peptidylprolyl isomerase [Phascolarctobacterium sp.]